MTTNDERKARLRAQAEMIPPTNGQPAESEEDEDTGDPPEEEAEEVTTAVEPAPKPKRSAGSTRPGRAFFRSELDRLFPTMTRLKFWKRDDTGHRAYIGAFSPQELLHSHDVEEFIRTYLMPRLGEGIYEYAVESAEGKVSKPIQTSVVDLNRSADDGGESHVVQSLLERLRFLEGKILEDTKKEPPPAPKSLLEQINETKELMETFRGKGGGQVDPLMFMLLQQQREPPRAVDDSRREIVEAIRALREEVDSLRSGGASAPAQEGGSSDVVGLVREIADMFRPAKSAEAASPDWLTQAERLKVIFGGGNPGVESPAVQQLKDEVRDLKARKAGGLLEEVKAARDLASIFGVGGGGLGKETAGDKVVQIFDTITAPDRVDAIGRLIEKLQTGRSSEAPKDKEGRPRLPAGFRKYLPAIRDATTDEERVMATMNALQFLGKASDWRGYILKLVELAKADKREELIAFVKAFVDGLKDANQIPTAAAESTVAAFTEHYAAIVDTVLGKRAFTLPAKEEPEKEDS